MAGRLTRIAVGRHLAFFASRHTLPAGGAVPATPTNAIANHLQQHRGEFCPEVLPRTATWAGLNQEWNDIGELSLVPSPAGLKGLHVDHP